MDEREEEASRKEAGHTVFCGVCVSASTIDTAYPGGDRWRVRICSTDLRNVCSAAKTPVGRSSVLSLDDARATVPLAARGVEGSAKGPFDWRSARSARRSRRVSCGGGGSSAAARWQRSYASASRVHTSAQQHVRSLCAHPGGQGSGGPARAVSAHGTHERAGVRRGRVSLKSRARCDRCMCRVLCRVSCGCRSSDTTVGVPSIFFDLSTSSGARERRPSTSRSGRGPYQSRTRVTRALRSCSSSIG
jgi:hypothetical protein